MPGHYTLGADEREQFIGWTCMSLGNGPLGEISFGCETSNHPKIGVAWRPSASPSLEIQGGCHWIAKAK